MRSKLTLLAVVMITTLLLGACGVKPTTTASTATGVQPDEITGDFSYTNDFAVETYYVEQAAALVDMHGFVVRDQLWQIPVDSQILGYMSIDKDKNTGSYHIMLPETPRGTLNDVSHNATKETGVQIYTVAYWPNLTGGPYSEGDDVSFGWPGYLTSVKIDTENHQEVNGGELVIWAPDGNEQFPTGFGPDGKLFTSDDPVSSIPAGWSVVNLDTTPFTVVREETPSVKLYEPQDVAIKDFSKDSYTDAFNKMFDIVKEQYAFNGIAGKAPDWDTLYSQIYPRIQDAEKNKDATAFYTAMRDFTFAFKDGHTGLSDGDIESQVFTDATSGGYGFAIQELSNGKVVVVYVLSGGPADQAGMKVGAEVTQFNGKTISDAIGAAPDLSEPHSMEIAHRYQQARYLLRAKVGDTATVIFQNSGASVTTSTLTAIAERDSFNYTSIYKGYDQNALPVESQILDTADGTIGYVKINSNYDDLNLIIRLFQRALKTFSDNQVNGLIIDMRVNSGGANLGLAGFLTNKEIPMGQLEYYSTTTKKFETEGPQDRVLPNQEQYTFPKEALLVGQGCASACELEAYGFSKVPGMIVVGQYPTGGVEAEVARGQFSMPEGITLQVPTGRFVNSDGSLFLEGVGVQPTLTVPVDETTVFATDDPILKAAEAAVLKPNGAGVTPSGAPTIVASADAEKFVTSGNAHFLEEYSKQSYSGNPKPDEHWTYSISWDTSKEAVWAAGWCAKDQATLDSNLKDIQWKFTLDGTDVDSTEMNTYPYSYQGMQCELDYYVLNDWPAGEHHLTIATTFTKAINDGTTDYPAGTSYYDYTVYVGK
jgi:C-terminal processing protease CtpA/Prc